MYNLAIPHKVKRNNKETVIAYKFGNTLYYKDTKVLDLSNKGIENDPDRPDNFIYKSKSYNFTRVEVDNSNRGDAHSFARIPPPNDDAPTLFEQMIPRLPPEGWYNDGLRRLGINIPSPFTTVIMLHSLCLTGNKLTKLPGSIKNLRYLRTLKLGYNKLSKLPRWIGGLKNLESLILTKNQLTSFPASIGRLTQLKELGLSGNNIESIPSTFKKLRPDIKIYYKRKQYTRDEFMELFKIVKTRVSSNTEIFNNEFSRTNKISNVRKNRLSYIKKNLNPNGTLKRVYSSNSLNRYMKDRNKGRLHGGTFSSNNIRRLTNKSTINKNVYLRNINIRLSNSSLNNFENTVKRIKNNLPPNVSKTDVNNMVRKIKPFIFNRILNKLERSPRNKRVSIMNTMKKIGLLNNFDINVLREKLKMNNSDILGLHNKNIIENFNKMSATTSTTRSKVKPLSKRYPKTTKNGNNRNI